MTFLGQAKSEFNNEEKYMLATVIFQTHACTYSLIIELSGKLLHIQCKIVFLKNNNDTI